METAVTLFKGLCVDTGHTLTDHGQKTEHLSRGSVVFTSGLQEVLVMVSEGSAVASSWYLTHNRIKTCLKESSQNRILKTA